MCPADPAAMETTHALKRLPKDRRRGRRETLPALMAATLEAAGRQADVLVINIGQDGLGLLAPEPIVPGTRVVIVAERRSAELRLTAEVVQCTAQAAGEWYVGCACADHTP